VRPLLRRIRAASFVAISFGVFWGVVGLVGGFAGILIRGAFSGANHPDAASEVGYLAVRLTIFGVLSGLAFAALFSATERGRASLALSRARGAIWGALAGSFLMGVATIVGVLRGRPLGPRALTVNLAALVTLGAVTAVLLIDLVRRVDRDRNRETQLRADQGNIADGASAPPSVR
jgi:hypothetical protein